MGHRFEWIKLKYFVIIILKMSNSIKLGEAHGKSKSKFK